MSKIKKIGASRVAIATMAAVLAASGAAIAADSGPQGGPQGGPPQGGPPQGAQGQGGQGGGPGAGQRGPGGLPGGKYLTYAEVHTYRRGTEKVIRTDAGKITAVDSSSVTIHERDGNDVTRALDEDTDVHIRGNADATTDDLSVGDTVVVTGEKDQAADDVMVRKQAS